jgi:hypothetical protein
MCCERCQTFPEKRKLAGMEEMILTPASQVTEHQEILICSKTSRHDETTGGVTTTHSSLQAQSHSPRANALTGKVLPIPAILLK